MAAPAAPPSDKLARELAAIYHAAEREIQRHLFEVLEADPYWLSPNGPTQHDNWLQGVRVQIALLLRALGERSAPLIAQIIREGYRWGLDLVDPEGHYTRPDDSLVTVLAERAQRVIAQADLLIGRRTDDIIGSAQARALAISRTLGESNTDAAARLRAHLIDLERQGLVTFIDGKRERAGMRLLALPCKDGKTRHYRMDYYAEMVAHTLGRQAATQGTMNRLRAVDYPTVKISQHPHRGVSAAWYASHDECAEWEGNVYAMTPAIAQATGLPLVGELPPYHPHCKHLAMPGPRVRDANGVPLGAALPGADAPVPVR